MPEPVRQYVITPHAAFEMQRRKIAEVIVRSVLAAPEQRYPVRSDRVGMCYNQEFLFQARSIWFAFSWTWTAARQRLLRFTGQARLQSTGDNNREGHLRRPNRHVEHHFQGRCRYSG